jgi:uncharacterized membrane protein
MRAGAPARRDEQGVVAIVVALLMVTVLTGFASFALDIGYKRMASRDMQAVADIVAMDMARELDGSPSGSLVGSVWNTKVATSLANQKGALGDALTVQSCDAAAVQAKGAVLSLTGICAYPGILNADGTFSSSGSAPATHVKVMTRTSVDYLLPVFATKGATARSAVAKAQKVACFGLGSYLMRLSTGESPILNAILGDALNTTVLSYSGLATVNLSILNLSTALGLATPSELATANVTAGQLFTAMATAISRNTPQTSADLSAIGLLQAAAAVNTPSFALADLIQLGPDAGAALGASVNALDLVKGAAALADGDHALNVPGLSIGIPGVTALNAKLYVVEGPQIYCGAEGGSTRLATQARLQVSYELAGLPAVSAPVKVNLDLRLANARGTLNSIDGCPTANNLKITLSDQTAADLDTTLTTKVSVLGVGLVDITATPSATPPALPTAVHNLALPQYYTEHYHAGSGSLGLGSVTNSNLTASLLGVDVTGNLLVQALLPAVRTTLNTVVAAVNSTVLPTLQSQLGLTIAGVDLWAVKPQSNLCSAPQLRG